MSLNCDRFGLNLLQISVPTFREITSNIQEEGGTVNLRAGTEIYAYIRVMRGIICTDCAVTCFKLCWPPQNKGSVKMLLRYIHLIFRVQLRALLVPSHNVAQIVSRNIKTNK